MGVQDKKRKGTKNTMKDVDRVKPTQEVYIFFIESQPSHFFGAPYFFWGDLGDQKNLIIPPYNNERNDLVAAPVLSPKGK
jgi:hypothetical protein